jgi:alpha-L-rhamnosidase
MKRLFTFLMMAAVFIFSGSSKAASISVASIECENKTNPLGVPLKDFRFGWELNSKERGQYQTARQIVVSSKKEFHESGNHNIWNSGIVQSSQNVFVPYGGIELQPAQTYFWRVKVWDKNNKESQWSETGKFVTGLFRQSDWGNAMWIGYEDLPDSLLVTPGVHGRGDNLGNKGVHRPVIPLFRKEFRIEKEVTNALLFISGLGHYEVSINGTKIGDNFLAPGWTYYDKTCLYNTYDVTENLITGKNAIGVIVGNGFHNVNRERYRKLVIAFGAPKTISKLKITYTDGSVETLVSGPDWKTSPSPITFTSIYGGEDYDAQLEQKGWDMPRFDDSKWKNAIPVKKPKGVLVPEIDYPLQVKEIFKVKKIFEPAPGIYLYDFGQNASGIVELKIKGKKGQKVKLTPGELIDEQKLVNQKASGGPYYFTYTLNGDGEEVWRPRFTYYGFRYVQVEGAASDTVKTSTDTPKILSLKFLHTRNSTAEVGHFECSNELFNNIYSLINWAIKSNLQSVVTDCPHREKLGWMEQTYLMGGSIHYNFDIYNLYKKLVFDMMDAQTNDGLVPDIAPEYVVFEGGFRDSPEWGSAAVILPCLIYKWYGDKSVMEKVWPMMKKYVEYLGSKSNNHILSHGLGDWYDLGPKFPGQAQLTPKELTATAIYYYDVKLLSQMAKILKNDDEAKRFSKLAEEIKDAFNKKFFNQETKVYSTSSQTAMAMPLCVGLVEEKYREEVFENLVSSINQSGKALTAGDVGFHFLVKALQEGGASQLIYEMNYRNDVPGYGFQLKKGATALTESWAALKEASNNHLMLGHIMEWFYSGLAGIRQSEDSEAYRKIIIEPHYVGDIQWVRAHYNSPNGRLLSEWQIKSDKVTLNIQVPVNSKAEVHIPARDMKKVTESGKVLSKNDDVIVGRTVNGMVNLQVGSGSYHFGFSR